MRILEKIDLSSMTSIKIGGTADLMIVPESEHELFDAMNKYKPKMYIGGGVELTNK